MFNTFTSAQASALGIRPEILHTAQSCCLLRQSRGIYTVLYPCRVHPEFVRLIDDEESVTLARSLREDGTNTGRAARFWRLAHMGLITVAPGIRTTDVVSHESAALIRCVPILPMRLTKVMVSNPGRSETQAVCRRRKRSVPEGSVGPWQGLAVATAARAALEMASDVSVEAGVIALDHVIRTAADPDSMRGVLLGMVEADGRFARSARLARCLAWATGLAESPAESLTVVRFAESGSLPRLRQQVEIYDEHGRFIARVDFLLDDDKILESDGAAKYKTIAQGGYRRDGEDPLEAEKRRQYALQALGYEVHRLMWADIIDPARFRKRMRQARIVLGPRGTRRSYGNTRL